MDSTPVVLAGLLLLFLYLLPAVVATYRNHRNIRAIAALNILLGWTLLGWVAALVWACTSNVEPDPGNSRTKKCPYCGEQILAVAIRCKHCHADLSQPAAS